MEGDTATGDEALERSASGMVTLREDGRQKVLQRADDARRGPARDPARHRLMREDPAAHAHLRVQGLRRRRRGHKTGVVDADTAARSAQKAAARQPARQRAERGARRRSKPDKASSERLKVKGPSVLSRMLSRLRASSSAGRADATSRSWPAITRQLGTLLGSGIPLAEALTRDHRPGRAAQDRDDVPRDPRAHHPGLEPRRRAGESPGDVQRAVRQHGPRRRGDGQRRRRAGRAWRTTCTSQRALRRKVISALLYPMMMIVIGMIVVAS